MKVKVLLLAAAAAVGMTGMASAATIWASAITDASKANAPGSARGDYASALGATDGSFYSLGLGGYAVFTFGAEFRAPASVVEITFGNRNNHKESVDVYGSADGVSFTYLTSVPNLSKDNTFTFAGSYNFLKLQDTSEVVAGRDGFDVDSISVTPVPLPAAGLLLAGGMGLLGARKLRRKG